MSIDAARTDALLTPEQLADHWQLSPKTLANQRALGIGPPYLRIGRAIRYSREACDQWLTQENNPTGDEPPHRNDPNNDRLHQ
jgi:hypothetical protein